MMDYSLNRWQGKVAVVTGASQGIGEAVATLLVESGLKVVGFARNEDKLKELSEKLASKPGKFFYKKVDLCEEDQIKAGFAYVADEVGVVQVLVNNAGCLFNTTLVDGDVQKWRRTMDTNLMGLAICCKEAVAAMSAADQPGHIVNVNSIFGHHVYPLPGLNMYPASKYAVTAVRDTLEFELKSLKKDIRVSSINPGLVATEIGKDDGIDMSSVNKDCLQPQDIAEAVKYILMTPPRVQIRDLTLVSPNQPF